MKMIREYTDAHNLVYQPRVEGDKILFEVAELQFDHREEPGYQESRVIIATDFNSSEEVDSWIREQRKAQDFTERAEAFMNVERRDMPDIDVDTIPQQHLSKKIEAFTSTPRNVGTPDIDIDVEQTKTIIGDTELIEVKVNFIHNNDEEHVHKMEYHDYTFEEVKELASRDFFNHCHKKGFIGNLFASLIVTKNVRETIYQSPGGLMITVKDELDSQLLTPLFK